MLNATETGNPEIRAENFDEKAKFNEILDKSVKVNRSLEPGTLEQRGDANLKETNMENRKLDKAPDNNAKAQELIKMISSDKDGYKKSLSFWEKLGAFLKSIFVFTFKNASGAQFKDVLAKERMDYFFYQLKKNGVLGDFFKNVINKIPQEKDFDKVKIFTALLECGINFAPIKLINSIASQIKSENDPNREIFLGSLLNEIINRFCGAEIEKIKTLTSDDEYIPSKNVMVVLSKILRDNNCGKLDEAVNFDYRNLLNVLYKNIENYLMFSVNSKSKIEHCNFIVNSIWSARAMRLYDLTTYKLEQEDYTPIISRESFKKLGEVFEKCMNNAFDKVIDKVDQKMSKLNEKVASFKQKFKEIREMCEKEKSEYSYIERLEIFREITNLKRNVKEELGYFFGTISGKITDDNVLKTALESLENKINELDEKNKTWENIKSEWKNNQNSRNFENRTKIVNKIHGRFDSEFIDKIQEEITKNSFCAVEEKYGEKFLSTVNFDDPNDLFTIVSAIHSSKYSFEFDGGPNLYDFATNILKAYKASKVQQGAGDNNAEAQKLIEMISSDKEGYKKSLSFWDRFSAFLKSIFVFTFKNASGAQFKDVLAKKRVEFFVNQLKDKNLFENFCKDTVSRISQEQNSEKAKHLAAFIGIVIDNGYIDIDADGPDGNKHLNGEYLNLVQNLAGEIRKAKDSSASADKGEILSSLLIKTLNRASSEGKFGDLIENLVNDLLPSNRYFISGEDRSAVEQKIKDFKCLIDPDYFNIPGLIEYLAGKIQPSDNEEDIKILGDLLRTALLNSYGEEIERVKNLKPGDGYVPSKEFGELMHYFYRSGKHVWQELKKLTGIVPDDWLVKMYAGAKNHLMFSVKSKSEMENCLSLIKNFGGIESSDCFIRITNSKLEKSKYTPIISKENFEKLGKAFEKCVNDAFSRVIDEEIKNLDENKAAEEKQKWEAIKAEWGTKEAAHTFEKRAKIYSDVHKNLDKDFIIKLQKEIEKNSSNLLSTIAFDKSSDELFLIMNAVCSSKFFLHSKTGFSVLVVTKNMQKAYEASKAQQSAGGDGAEVKPNEV